MKLLHAIRDLAENATGWYIRRRAPWGTSMFQDMAELLRPDDVRCVLDVGANVGQSAREYLAHYPKARIHSFEPVPGTFRKLHETITDPRFTAYALAMGSQAGEVSMHVSNDDAASDLSAIGGPHPFMDPAASHTETVPMTTLDEWTARHAVTRVDLLKVDTEGHDLEVLKGAAQLLREQRIRFVATEAGIDPANTVHVPYTDLLNLLAGHGYAPFGFYDQYVHDAARRPVVRRVNVVFTTAQWKQRPSPSAG
jgi:FkbM family methyltransferase